MLDDIVENITIDPCKIQDRWDFHYSESDFSDPADADYNPESYCSDTTDGSEEITIDNGLI